MEKSQCIQHDGEEARDSDNILADPYLALVDI